MLFRSKTIGLNNGTSAIGLMSWSNYLSGNPDSFGTNAGTNSPGAQGVGNVIRFGLATKAQLGSNLDNSGMVADLGSASAISINALRTAFAIQKLYEKDARGGTRYIEIIKAHFGVTSPDSRQQRPEYLGGNRIPVNINQVVQMSSNSGADLLGDTAALS